LARINVEDEKEEEKSDNEK